MLLISSNLGGSAHAATDTGAENDLSDEHALEKFAGRVDQFKASSAFAGAGHTELVEANNAKVDDGEELERAKAARLQNTIDDANSRHKGANDGEQAGNRNNEVRVEVQLD